MSVKNAYPLLAASVNRLQKRVAQLESQSKIAADVDLNVARILKRMDTLIMNCQIEVDSIFEVLMQYGRERRTWWKFWLRFRNPFTPDMLEATVKAVHAKARESIDASRMAVADAMKQMEENRMEAEMASPSEPPVDAQAATAEAEQPEGVTEEAEQETPNGNSGDADEAVKDAAQAG